VSEQGRRHSPVRTMWQGMSGQKWELAGAGVIGALASLSAVALLGVSAWLIATAAEMPPVLTLSVAAVMVRFLALSRAIFRYVERLVGHDSAFRGLAQLRVVVYRSLERLAPTGLAAFGRGDLLARLVADVDAALDLPLRVILPWAQAALVSIGTVVFMVWLLPAAGLLVGLLSAAALVLVPWLVSRTSKAAQERMAPAQAELSSAVVRALDATPEINAFGAVDAVDARVALLDGNLTRLNARESFTLGLGSGVGVVVQGAAVTAALLVAVPAVFDGRIEPVWLAVIALLPLALFDVLGTLPSAALAYQRLAGSAARISAVESTPSPVTAWPDPVPVPSAFAGLRLRDVSASWRPDQPHTVSGIDLDVEPGGRVAVVGPSGAGKSTLAAVLMGFLPYSGSVRLSGVEVREADGDDVRRHVGMLTQLAHIFDTTIADNVRIGDPQATDEQVRQALDTAQLGAWIDRLPSGVDTTVGSFGVAISGGERQRVALARLLLSDHPFVILDEPTEHLDGPTADALSRTLAEALSGSTLLVITHRLIGLEDYDRIVQLAGGRVAAQGTHAELMAMDGWYAQQFRLESERQDMAQLLPSLPIGRGVPGPVG
jgi:ATP-binding cassette, subfamily C, bacterial CydCD